MNSSSFVVVMGRHILSEGLAQLQSVMSMLFEVSCCSCCSFCCCNGSGSRSSSISVSSCSCYGRHVLSEGLVQLQSVTLTVSEVCNFGSCCSSSSACCYSSSSSMSISVSSCCCCYGRQVLSEGLAQLQSVISMLSEVCSSRLSESELRQLQSSLEH